MAAGTQGGAGRRSRRSCELPGVAATLLPRTFIYCTDKPAGDSLAPLAKRLRGDTSWRYRELASGHDAMVTAPNEIAALIVEPTS